MRRVLVIHYDAEEAAILAGRIRRENYDAYAYTGRGASGIPAVRRNPPDAIVIDLSRLPSFGRAMGALLRESKGLRQVPLVFVEGDPAKTRLVKKTLPDAVFTNVLKIGADLERAIREAPAEPVAPVRTKVPLAGKLRIKPASTVALLYEPDGFREALGLPKGTRVVRKPGDAAVILLFVKSTAALGRELPRLAAVLERGQMLWIAWPKKASAVKSDLAMPQIVQMCVSLNLSGSKICAIDETWSGLAVTVSRKRGVKPRSIESDLLE